MEIEALTSYLVSWATLASIYGILTLGLNIHFGHTGLFNIGIAGFFCIGAYVSALITSPLPQGIYAQYVQQLFGLNQPFIFGLLGSALTCGILAFLLGIPTLRLKEEYLGIATIGIAETVRLIFHNEQWLANGSKGLMGLPQPLSFYFDPAYYNYFYLSIVFFVLLFLFFLIERATRSPWGRVLRAIREDEVAASMLGKDLFRFKMEAFVLGSMIMGVGGALYAHFTRAISPDVFTPLYGTFIIWVMLFVGGTGNNKGALLGSFVVWGIWEGTKFITDFLPYSIQARAPYMRFLLIGILLEVILIKKPEGIMGEEKKVSKL